MKKKYLILFSAFAIFPPSKKEGKIDSLNIRRNTLQISRDECKSLSVTFLPIPKAIIYLFLFKGDMKFGKLFMVGNFFQVVDKDESDVFNFYLEKNFAVLVKVETATIESNKSLKVITPD